MDNRRNELRSTNSHDCSLTTALVYVTTHQIAFESFKETLIRVGREGPQAMATLPPSPQLRPGMREALRYRMGKKRVLLDLLISLAAKVDLSMGL